MLKQLCQKEKLLVVSNFTTCHIVFNSRLLQRHEKSSLCGKGFKVQLLIENCLEYMCNQAKWKCLILIYIIHKGEYLSISRG